MTDTEILDYLQESYTMAKRMPCDVQIGNVSFTLGIRPGTLRDHLLQAIAEDQARRVKHVTKILVGNE